MSPISTSVSSEVNTFRGDLRGDLTEVTLTTHPIMEPEKLWSESRSLPFALLLFLIPVPQQRPTQGRPLPL